MIHSSYYAPAQRPHILRKQASILWSLLQTELHGAMPIFCYSGMSGISTATALICSMSRKRAPQIGMVYVRKEAEVSESHGKAVEFTIPPSPEGTPPPILVFVDDFISSGGTLQRVMVKAIKILDSNEVGYKRDRYLTAMIGDINLDGEPAHDTSVKSAVIPGSWA